ncbi:cysteine rich repeat-containing protein [Rhodoplanes sp. TEM]|uniref:Cysteine rich repeat-containing protein n=1 Tax=Rhodoplanes tepidamans TaxID=200616 RepID=A0ABT5J989_RHOTP|nr:MULTISPECIES: cysteine rich repeat-containing protein [Rhodoplanes]MDC7786220.1 cysteine rich repeat-containing protein [Rhodoplanes tepidamans]MDC7982409.1 cysteine rich repeat-containing protein [Rhodoplanes sp. TEM]MDQ0355019.1 hypothetical protein [Rhodoplanes tepidamans]
MRSILAASGLALVLAAATHTPAAAQDQNVLRDACKGDYQRLCQGVQPGGGRIIKCLQDQGDKLTPACKTALSARK